MDTDTYYDTQPAYGDGAEADEMLMHTSLREAGCDFDADPETFKPHMGWNRSLREMKEKGRL
jgi:hypothetical protein